MTGRVGKARLAGNGGQAGRSALCRIAQSAFCHQVEQGRRTRIQGLLYNAYEMQRSLLAGASNWAAIGARMLTNPALPLGYFGLGPAVAGALEVFAHFH
jgi:hypothetical protein